VSAQERDPDSTLHFARSLIAARKQHPALREGGLDLLEGPAMAFVREGQGERMFCAFNLEDAPAALALPGPAQPFLVTGEARLAGTALALGPHAAWIGTL
jgi:alpha-glucosidase